MGFKIAKVFETCQRGANINWGKKLEAKKEGGCEKERGGDSKVQNCLKAVEPQIDRQAQGGAGAKRQRQLRSVSQKI